VVDLGYSASAFTVALDVKERRPLCDVSFLGAPRAQAKVGDRPGAGLEATFRTVGGKVGVRRGEGEEDYRIEVEVGRLRTQSLYPLVWKGGLQVAGGPPALTVVAPVEGEAGGVNVTQKRGALRASGTLEVGGRLFNLAGGVGGTDYTQGYLGRRTSWRWAFGAGRLGDGTPVGFNLVEGFNEGVAAANENALWVGDKTYPLGRARFEYDKRELLDPWVVRTVDGAVELRFRPLYVHRQERNLRWIVSRYLQPLGLFEGTLKAEGRTYELNAVPGVTEEQDMLW
jgi:hypothetical protein